MNNVDPTNGILILGVIIVIITLVRLMGQRRRQNNMRQQQREVAILAAQEAERKIQAQTLHPKSQVLPPKTRVLLGDPYGVPFTGAVQGSAAKWEAEIHQIGRQIIGQIDSKMAALQAITLDANRTANRLEILVEHLEQIAYQQSQRTQNTGAESAEEGSPTVIATTTPVLDAAPLTEVLKELTDDLEGIRKTIKRSTTFGEQTTPLNPEPAKPESATVLRIADQPARAAATGYPVNTRDEVSMLSNHGFEPQEIARKLNISLGEVDLILQVQQNRLDKIT
jgi:DNA-directed RNA polymerase specialized sigma24 family protein